MHVFHFRTFAPARRLQLIIIFTIIMIIYIYISECVAFSWLQDVRAYTALIDACASAARAPGGAAMVREAQRVFDQVRV